MKKSLSYFSLVLLLSGAATLSQVANASDPCENSGQEHSACMKEINAVKDKKQMQTYSKEELRNNQLQRCNVFKGDEQLECVARLKLGTQSGSVKSGGTLTEVTTLDKPQ